MDFAPAFLLQRFWYRFCDFFHHWYVDGSRAIGHRFIAALEDIHRTLAVRITVRHFFQPLYRDYTFVGRLLGIFFRTCRIVIGVAVYLLIIVLFALFYLAWLATPALIIFYAVWTH